ncbi:Os01g0814200 [Oryza sativa Japonica Group]|uniref:Os01g0814200 protein n=2 Tax=Oryza sativa subsp. japonica TaxID=39947 RepID=Q5N766_ORYSJ|nr:inositol-1, 4, 5-trisphosphate 5-phosphatase-like protein [Oryza sativa Japonica Group]BAS74905.1 Os01g0814200 [Oryza sativa Japonica Group]
MAFTGEEKMKGCRPKLFGAKENKVSNRTDKPSCNTGKFGPSSSNAASSSPLRAFSVKGMRLSHFLAQTPNNTTTEPVRIFVATWNVGGKAPTAELNLDDFLPPDDHSDIYVLGWVFYCPFLNILDVENIFFVNFTKFSVHVIRLSPCMLIS